MPLSIFGSVILSLLALAMNFVSDDAFITFRYVANFLQGLGPVYNAHQYVEGFSSPLWFILLSTLGVTHIDLVLLGRFLSLLFAVLHIPLLVWYLRKKEISVTGIVAAVGLVSTSTVFASWALGGLEITLYSFILLALFVLIDRVKLTTKQIWLLGFLTVLLILTRMEGILFAGVLLLWVLLKAHKKDRLTSGLLYSAIIGAGVVALTLVRYSVYGDMLPNTYYAKVGHSFTLYARGFAYVWNFGWYHAYAIPLLGIVGLAFWKRTKTHTLLAIWTLTIVIETILVGGDGLAMFRFLLPTLPYLAIVTALFLQQIPLKKQVIFWVLYAIVLFKGFMPDTGDVQYILYLEQKEYEIPRWTAVGNWLHDNAKPGDSIAATPIGVVGYYSGLHVYDMMGLTDKHIAKKQIEVGAGWAGHEKHDGAYILEQKPTYLLLGNIQVLDTPLPLDDPQFVHPENINIRVREDDMFASPRISNYEKKVVQIGPQLFFHFLELKK